MDNEIMELLKKYEPDCVSVIEGFMNQGVNVVNLSREALESANVSRTAYNLIQATAGRKERIVSNSPNICRAFAESQVSGMSIYIMDKEDIFHTGILKGITEDNLESMEIDGLTERKRIMEVIQNNILPKARVVDVDADADERHAFLWGLLGFITVMPLSLALYLLLSGRRDTAAHNLGWGIVLNLILCVICIPLLLF